MNKALLIIFSLLFSSIGNRINAQDLTAELSNYAAQYVCPDANIAKCTFKGYNIDPETNTLTITFGGGFSEQHFTVQNVKRIYSDINYLLPQEMKKMKLCVMTENHPIEFFIPNSMRSADFDKSRILSTTYNGAPWVTNISRPYKPEAGLEGCHISLWQSHGRYWRNEKSEWYWQRPRLFCTTEDLLSQSFVVPYIIPMLQNAGAVVFTPRERDYQSHEVIVDNDQPNVSGHYIETFKLNPSELMWSTAKQAAFANTKPIYNVCDTPFVSGTARITTAVDGKEDVAYTQWIPYIPASGKYAVYVTYPSFPNSIPDAHYVVFHKGGMTEFRVNQRIGGGTWVYLGSFEFNEGEIDAAKVVLTNISSTEGVVSADAVRFGGGMGNVLPTIVTTEVIKQDTTEIKRYTHEPVQQLSGLPRWAEGAKYSAFWYGQPYSTHSGGFDNDEYKNDIRSRSLFVNNLSGGSVYNPDENGRGVPFELNLAFHTDAGYSLTDDFIGSLGIYMTDENDGLTASGMDRYASRDLASAILTNIHTDLSKYGWNVRALWNKDYGEARTPASPSAIIEMLSHQNFADMKMAYDPQFKFDFCRSVYKSIVKFVATTHKSIYTIQPLPVQDFHIKLDESRSVATLSWKPTKDALEPTAVPTAYILYTRQGNNDFDNGQIIHGTSVNIELNKDIVYSFKITALNDGGESFPSEILSAYIAPNSKGQILVLNAFTRLEGPASYSSETEQGFRLDLDPGVPYGAFTGFCGLQKGFDKRKAGSEASDGLGSSGSEYEGTIFMGNTFDYPFIHGLGIASLGEYSFCSSSESALLKNKVRLSDYKMVDVIYGTQKDFNQSTISMLSSYNMNGGRVMISGANVSNIQNPDLNISHISGCGTEFDIYRRMNPIRYAIPSVSVVEMGQTIFPLPESAFPMLAYSNMQSAGMAYDGSDTKTIILGFPIEGIIHQDKINELMRSFVVFLTANQTFNIK